MTTSWDPAQYERYKAYRDRPALDLMVQIPADLAPREIWDLGCGTGEHAALLALRHATARVHGLDSSPDMLRQARNRQSDVDWVLAGIEDFAPDEMLEAMDLNDPFELTGLYEGIPLPEKSVSDQPTHPDLIWLFRRAILDEWCDRGNVSLTELVTHVVIHELAHHFGWSDEDIAAIDPWWE